MNNQDWYRSINEALALANGKERPMAEKSVADVIHERYAESLRRRGRLTPTLISVLTGLPPDADEDMLPTIISPVGHGGCRSIGRDFLREGYVLCSTCDGYGHLPHAVDGTPKRCPECSDRPPYIGVVNDGVRASNTKRRGSQARRARKQSAFIEVVDPKVVWDRHGGICHLCGTPADPSRWELEHIRPLAKGGAHSYANCAVSHPSCNRRKSDAWDGIAGEGVPILPKPRRKHRRTKALPMAVNLGRPEESTGSPA